MLDWTTIREGVRELVSDLAGIEATWLYQPDVYVPSPTDALARLSIVALEGVARDEVRIAEPDDGELPVAVQGLRMWTLSVRVESTDEADDRAAVVYTDRLRSKLRLPSTREALAALDTSLVAVAGDSTSPTTYDQRARVAHVLDVRLLTSCAIDDTPIDWIGSVEVAAAPPDISGTITVEEP